MILVIITHDQTAALPLVLRVDLVAHCDLVHNLDILHPINAFQVDGSVAVYAFRQVHIDVRGVNGLVGLIHAAE